MARETQLDRIEERLREVQELLEAVEAGARWMLDPPEIDDSAASQYPEQPRPRKKKRIDRNSLAHTQARAYIRGQDAFKEGIPRDENPYENRQGGWWCVWDFSWDDASKGLDRLSQNRT